MDFEAPARVSKNPNLGVEFLDFGNFGNSRNFGFFLDFEQIPRVSTNPKLGLGFLDFWNFGNSRNFGFFWILSKFLEFPKIRNLGWDFWIFGFWNLEFPKFQNSKNPNPSFGFLETRAGPSQSKNRANSSGFQNSEPWGGFFWVFGILETRGICSIFGF